MSNLQETVEAINRLPSLPHTVQRTLKLINNPKSKASDIGKEIAMDPALTAKVLRLVNSAFYGLQTEVTTVAQAIIYLGSNTIKNLALTASIFDTLKFREVSRERFLELMHHSIATGFAAELLSSYLELNDDNELFTFGILHDLGKVIEIEQFPESFIEILTYAEEKKISFIKAEKEKFDLNHVELSDILFKRWTLPVKLQAAIKAHHDISSADLIHKKNSAVLSVADHVAKESGIGFSFCYDTSQIQKEVYSTLLIDETVVKKTILKLKKKKMQVREFLRCLDS